MAGASLREARGRLTPDDRLAWLLRVSRLLSSDGRYRTQSSLLQDFAKGSLTRQVSLGTISRWESGHLRAPHAVVRRYEELLGLPRNRLVAVIDTTYRYSASSAMRLLGLSRQRPPDDLTVHRRLQELLDQACSDAIMTGSDWDELTWVLSTLPFALPPAIWTELADRLLVEMIIADGVLWHQRYEAFNRLLGHPIGQHAAIAACVLLGADPTNQVVIETVSALDFSSHPDANSAVITQLQNPTSERSQLGALLACSRKIRFRHFTPPQRHQIADVLNDLIRSGAEGDLACAQATHILEMLSVPRSISSSTQESKSVLAGHEAERAIVVNRLAGTSIARTPNVPETFHDDVLPRLIEEMLFAVSWDVRLTATSLIAVSPYSAGVSQALFDEFKAESTLLGNPDWANVVLSALRFVGGVRERRLLEQMVLNGGVPSQTVLGAAYSIGHLSDGGDSSALATAIDLHAARWRRSRSPQSAALLAGLVYSAGVSGQKALLFNVHNSYGAPAPLRSAASWWLNLPSNIAESARL